MTVGRVGMLELVRRLGVENEIGKLRNCGISLRYRVEGKKNQKKQKKGERRKKEGKKRREMGTDTE